MAITLNGLTNLQFGAPQGTGSGGGGVVSGTAYFISSTASAPATPANTSIGVYPSGWSSTLPSSSNIPVGGSCWSSTGIPNSGNTQWVWSTPAVAFPYNNVDAQARYTAAVALSEADNSVNYSLSSITGNILVFTDNASHTKSLSIISSLGVNAVTDTNNVNLTITANGVSAGGSFAKGGIDPSSLRSVTLYQTTPPTTGTTQLLTGGLNAVDASGTSRLTTFSIIANNGAGTDPSALYSVTLNQTNPPTTGTTQLLTGALKATNASGVSQLANFSIVALSGSGGGSGAIASVDGYVYYHP